MPFELPDPTALRPSTPIRPPGLAVGEDDPAERKITGEINDARVIELDGPDFAKHDALVELNHRAAEAAAEETIAADNSIKTVLRGVGPAVRTAALARDQAVVELNQRPGLNELGRDEVRRELDDALDTELQRIARVRLSEDLDNFVARYPAPGSAKPMTPEVAAEVQVLYAGLSTKLASTTWHEGVAMLGESLAEPNDRRRTLLDRFYHPVSERNTVNPSGFNRGMVGVNAKLSAAIKRHLHTSHGGHAHALAVETAEAARADFRCLVGMLRGQKHWPSGTVLEDSAARLFPVSENGKAE